MIERDCAFMKKSTFLSNFVIEISMLYRTYRPGIIMFRTLMQSNCAWCNLLDSNRSRFVLFTSIQNVSQCNRK